LVIPEFIQKEVFLTISPVLILLVDDFKPWHRFIATMLQKQPEMQLVGQVFDGFHAVQQAQELQPDLILLDIGLPTINGIEAARRIREVSPHSKILFVSQNRSSDIAEEALRTGASGYVVKSDVAVELLPAIEAVLEGKPFVSSSLAGRVVLDLTSPPAEHLSQSRAREPG
jgi:DNA-binding NarL/FixJ family response regulator